MEPEYTQTTTVPAPNKRGLNISLILLVLFAVVGVLGHYLYYQQKQAEMSASVSQEVSQENSNEALKEMYREKYKYTTPKVCNEGNERCLFFHNAFGLLSSRSLYFQDIAQEQTLSDYSNLSSTCDTTLFASTSISQAIRQSANNKILTDALIKGAQETVCKQLLTDYTYLAVETSSSTLYFLVTTLGGLKDHLYLDGESGISNIGFEGKDIVWTISGNITCSHFEQSYRLRWDGSKKVYLQPEEGEPKYSSNCGDDLE